MRPRDDLFKELASNLDDPRGVGFNDTKLRVLLDEALFWLVNRATTKDYFYRQVEAELNIISGTSAYVLPVNIRKVLMIEREHDSTRTKGTLIEKRRRNDIRNDWTEPIMFENFQQTDGVGELKRHLIFANKLQPQDNYIITVTYAPEIQKWVAPTTVLVDLESEFENMLILRATVQGYGGEKNADQFWMAQYQTALMDADIMFEDEQFDRPRQVQRVDPYGY